MDINPNQLNPIVFENAAQALEAANGRRFVHCARSSNHALSLVLDNLATLRKRGIYEEALLAAYTECSSNYHAWDAEVIRGMFELADRAKLRTLGSPLPGPGPFTVFRGVAGHGRVRRLNGLSW